MTFHASNGFDLAQISPFVLDKIPMGITVIDLEGRILYFNEYSSQIRDRKPEYLGRDIRLCHKEPESIARIDRILEEFKSGRRQEVCYDSTLAGEVFAVTISPLVVKDRLIGCIQSLIKKEAWVQSYTAKAVRGCGSLGQMG